MRASSKGVRSGRTFSPPTPFVLGPKASSRAHFDFDCGHRLRGKFRPCQGSDGYTDSGGFVPPTALVRAPTVGLSARRLLFFFSFRISSGPIGAHDESFGRRERLRLLSSLCNLCGLCRLKPRALLPNDFTYRRRSQCSSLFLRRPSFLRPGPFVSDLLLRAFLRVLLHVSLRASPRKGRFPSATRCRHDAARRA